MKMSDPRLSVIEKRFDKVGKIIAVSSGKGGVGKSIIATSLALDLKNRGYKVGLLDLDFTSPSTHVILGVEGLYPEEEHGIIPPETHDLKYMSITHYSLDEPAPLRGEDVSNAIIELLAITRWEKLDYLIIDMPPGIGDATLDTIRFMPRLEFLVITTPSKVAYQSVKRLLLLLIDLDIPIIGVIENMVMKPSDSIKSEIHKLDLDYLGNISWDDKLEESIGESEKMEKTEFYEELSRLTPKIV
jgi:ATP-binding protein involved in chromosome partitioning